MHTRIEELHRNKHVSPNPPHPSPPRYFSEESYPNTLDTKSGIEQERSLLALSSAGSVARLVASSHRLGARIALILQLLANKLADDLDVQGALVVEILSVNRLEALLLLATIQALGELDLGGATAAKVQSTMPAAELAGLATGSSLGGGSLALAGLLHALGNTAGNLTGVGGVEAGVVLDVA